jgi:hypothetical protein
LERDDFRKDREEWQTVRDTVASARETIQALGKAQMPKASSVENSRYPDGVPGVPGRKFIEMKSPLAVLWRGACATYEWTVPLIMGALLFGAVMGSAIIEPGKLEWLAGDKTSASYIGWLFFRHQPWTWPLGVLHGAGAPASSLLNIDSIPLLAVFFKLLGRGLPADFQYMGMWLAACYVLQGLFAWRLLALFTRNKMTVAAGTMLFLLSPILLLQAQADFALSAHWMLLAALYLYYASPNHRRPWQWLALMALAITVQGYLAVMVFAAGVAWLFRRDGTKESMSPVAAGFRVAWAVACLLVLAWLAGYFAVPWHPVASRHEPMNMLAPLMPLGAGPFRMSGHGMADGVQQQGFNYLGLGVLGALAISMGFLASPRYRSVRTAELPTTDMPLIAACVVLALFAVSGTLGLGSHTLHVLAPDSMPGRILDFPDYPGRLFWLGYYVLVLAALRGMMWLPPRTMTLALGLVVALQLVDLMPYLHAMHAASITRMKQVGFPHLDSPFWQEARSRYGRLHVIPGDVDDAALIDYGYLVAARGFGVDAPNDDGGEPALLRARQQYADAFMHGQLDPGSLYLVSFATWQKLQASPDRFPVSTGVGIVDGMTIVAPAWFDDGNASYLHRQGVVDYPPITLTRQIRFAESGNGLPFLAQGWNAPEGGGVWSSGHVSTLAFHLPDMHGDLNISLDVLPYLPKAFPKLLVNVQANGRQLAQWAFKNGRPGPATRLTIPATWMSTQQNILLTFSFAQPRSPRQAGESADPRMLALSLRGMKLERGL